MSSAHQAAEAIPSLKAIGARVTAPRVQVLDALRGATTPLTHRELLDAVQAAGGLPVDRVTVYRVLDWLVEQGLAAKAADAQGVFRFASAQGQGVHDSHVHFRCSRCGGVFCLKEAPPPRPRLPRGFLLERMSVDILGQCARCAGAN